MKKLIRKCKWWQVAVEVKVVPGRGIHFIALGRSVAGPEASHFFLLSLFYVVATLASK